MIDDHDIHRVWLLIDQVATDPWCRLAGSGGSG